MVTETQTRTCGCGKEVAVVPSRMCSCGCHDTGLTYDQLKASRTTVRTFAWGKVTITRYDHIFNLIANFIDKDTGVGVGIDFADGCVGNGPHLTPETLPAYLALLEVRSPKIMAAIEKRRALGERIKPLQARASIEADKMFALIRS